MREHMSPVVFSREVYGVERGTFVKAAVARMVEQQISSVLVFEGQRTVGIFTERDAVRRVLHPGLDPATTPVDQVMTADVQTIGPETSIQEALALMSQGRYRHLPVLNEGEVMGMVSVGDLTHEVNVHNEHLFGYITGVYR